MNDKDRALLYRLSDGGMTQEKVAEFLGVSRRTVYRHLLARKVVEVGALPVRVVTCWQCNADDHPTSDHDGDDEVAVHEAGTGYHAPGPTGYGSSGR